jgi:hypothetical protein
MSAPWENKSNWMVAIFQVCLVIRCPDEYDTTEVFFQGPPGTLYLPNVVPSFDRNLFGFPEDVCAVQPPVFDQGGKTILPKDLPLQLQANTTVRVSVRLGAWLPPGSKSGVRCSLFSVVI